MNISEEFGCQPLFTELEEKRAMSSFQHLIAMAIKSPEKTLVLMQRFAATPPHYADEVADLYKIAMLHGALLSGIYGAQSFLESCRNVADAKNPIRPCDVFGPRRKHFLPKSQKGSPA